MSNTVFKLFNKKVRNNLSIKEQNELMGKISQAERFNDVQDLFNVLYDNLSPQIWKLLSKKFIPPLTVDDLRDIFQESWIKILESRGQFDGKHNVFNWVYVIKKNMVIDKIRKISREREIFVEDSNDTDEFYLDKKSNDIPVDVNLINSETVDIIKDIIWKIEDRIEKEIMVRRLFNDEKLEFIAKEMGIPLSTVYNIIKKTLNRVKPQILTLING